MVVQNNFTLADTVIQPEVDGEKITFQLLKKDMGGNLRLQYQGTQVLLLVLSSIRFSIKVVLTLFLDLDLDFVLVANSCRTNEM